MARMWVKSVKGRYSVTISGRLRGRDLRRLEHACGPALEQKVAPLTVRVVPGSDLDESAQEYLDRLAARGALLVFQ